MPRKIEKGFVASEQEKIPEARTCSIGSVKYSYLLDEVRWHDDDPYTNCSWAGPGRAPPG